MDVKRGYYLSHYLRTNSCDLVREISDESVAFISGNQNNTSFNMHVLKNNEYVKISEFDSYNEAVEALTNYSHGLS